MSAGLLWMVMADATLLLAGAGPVWPVARRVGLPLLPRAALSLLTGAGLLALVTTVVGVLGARTGLWPAIGPAMLAAAGAGTAVLIRGRFAGPARRPAADPSAGSSAGRAAGAVGYAIVLLVAAPYAWTGWRLPVSSNDEYMMWALRGRMLAGGGLDPAVFGGAANQYTFQSRDYPLGLPALFSWMFGWTGADSAEYAAHVQVPLLGAAGLIVAVWAVGTLVGPVAGALVAPGLFTATQVGQYTGSLYFADLPVAAAGLAVAVLLLRWLADRRPEWLLLAAGPATAGVYLKAEGTLFIAAGCVAAAVVALARRAGRRGWWAPLVLAGGSILALLPWQVWLWAQHVPSRFFGGQKWGALTFDQYVSRGRLILRNMAQYWPVPFSTYFAIAAVGLAVLLAVLVPAVRVPVAFLGLSLILIVGGLWFQYLLWELRGPYPPAFVDSYLKFNAGRVELLPAVLGWVIAVVALGGAVAAAPASAAGRSRRRSPRSAGPDPPVPTRSPAHAARR
jgi:hypothetical protein